MWYSPTIFYPDILLFSLYLFSSLYIFISFSIFFFCLVVLVLVAAVKPLSVFLPSALAQSYKLLSYICFFICLLLCSFSSSFCPGVGLSCPCRVGEGIRAFLFLFLFFSFCGVALETFKIGKIARFRSHK